ncbi:hypothetical protein Clocel_1664 [Clostridium cellulovorans 743B]|uniref:Uncharacterized protein n=1 Tax=Clostridium cellulovorans (strain ATCC 35296 / DSM 3052 / OCM 3 / 743B) TaxID=573061 RepID=D9SKB2_CLOC7|nr:hypothetical protein Clocel_1664 [Clostridium cellulovorans 743B]
MSSITYKQLSLEECDRINEINPYQFIFHSVSGMHKK